MCSDMTQPVLLPMRGCGFAWGPEGSRSCSVLADTGVSRVSVPALGRGGAGARCLRRQSPGCRHPSSELLKVKQPPPFVFLTYIKGSEPDKEPAQF